MTEERPSITEQLRRPALFWGIIRSAVEERATTAELWQAIRDYAESTGLGLPAGMFRAVNEMRSLAVLQRERATALTEAINRARETGEAVPLTADYIAPDINTATGLFAGQVPQYTVYATTRVRDATGQEFTTHVRVDIGSTVPSTLSDLANYVDQFAQLMNEGYDLEMIDVEQYSLIQL
jgi:hypothetical protein